MAIDLTLWNTHCFTEDSLPAWPCPFCTKGTLRYKKEKGKEIIVKDFRASSAEEYDIDGECIGCFACLLECDRESCGGSPLSFCGDICQYIDTDENGKPFWEHGYEPVFFNPPLHIFPISPACPHDIRKELVAAFRLFWCDPGACVNHQRTAIEKRLTVMKIPRYSKKAGRRSRISLHQRIEKLPENTEEQRDIKDALLTVKFLGNEGSHAGYITRDDALDGFEQLELLLDDQGRERQENMRKRRKQILKERAPRGKAKIRRQERAIKKHTESFNERLKRRGDGSTDSQANE